MVGEQKTCQVSPPSCNLTTFTLNSEGGEVSELVGDQKSGWVSSPSYIHPPFTLNSRSGGEVSELVGDQKSGWVWPPNYNPPLFTLNSVCVEVSELEGDQKSDWVSPQCYTHPLHRSTSTPVYPPPSCTRDPPEIVAVDIENTFGDVDMWYFHVVYLTDILDDVFISWICSHICYDSP